jgi:TPR repeat protein
MNFPPHGYRPAEPQQQSSEAPWEEHPPLAHDAPTLRAEEFDPVWVAESEAQQREAMTQHDLDRLEEIITSEHFRARRPRSPNYVPPPPPPLQRRHGGLRWTVGTFAVLVASSSLVALYATGRLPLPVEWQEGVANQGTRLAALVAPGTEQIPAAETAEPKAAEQAKPRLVVNGASADNNEEILLGVMVESPRQGATGVISGLAQGTTLSAGKPWGATGWVLQASELATAYLRPPAGFTGVMEYTVALQLADGTVADRQTMRLEWAAANTQPPQSPPSPQSPAPPQAPVASRSMDAQEIAHMVKRGEELLNTGDVASARLLLRRAAEARDARAAFALAATYDPSVLKRLGVYGSAPDVAIARDWYEKAKQYGSREAPQRLELLASQYR